MNKRLVLLLMAIALAGSLGGWGCAQGIYCS
jgi:hypothetical protein